MVENKEEVLPPTHCVGCGCWVAHGEPCGLNELGSCLAVWQSWNTKESTRLLHNWGKTYLKVDAQEPPDDEFKTEGEPDE